CRSRLEAGHEPIRYPLRGSIRSTVRVNLNLALNTEILTLPAHVMALSLVRTSIGQSACANLF
ncbi:hypothetical protein, partial [Ralstonia solanacearum]|uniref:hypothetical protein n=1 Tax=Ralstonia solanacearum TaxID=305 RepID=UPI001E291BF0